MVTVNFSADPVDPAKRNIAVAILADAIAEYVVDCGNTIDLPLPRMIAEIGGELAEA